MIKRKLTKGVVDSLQPRESDYVEWCSQLPGFGCRVRQSGSKTFVTQYRIGGRNSPVRKVTIGTFGKLTVDQARDQAKIVLAKAELGEDVAYQRARDRGEQAVAQLCDEYLKNGCEAKKASTLATDRGRIERHIKPLLGRKKIGSVTGSDIRRFLQDIAEGRTALDQKTGKHGRSIVTGGKGAATRTVRLLGGIFSYAVEAGYLPSNPCRGVKLFPDGKGKRFLSPDELGKLGAALTAAETIGLPWSIHEGENSKHRPRMQDAQREVISPYAVAAIRLLMLTGCRVREILTLRWSEIDFDNGWLNLSDSKTGARVVMLGAPALQILAELPRAGTYVIAGSTVDMPRSDIKRPWDRIRAYAELPDIRLHDLRHSFASVGAGAGMGLAVVGKLLGHASPTTTARYAHFADNPLRRASDSIANTIAAAMRLDGTSKSVTIHDGVER